MQDITFIKRDKLRGKPAKGAPLGFGRIFTDHMFIMDYDEGKGWHSPRIVPNAPFEMDPAAMCLHYAQEVFEGLKAYCAKDGRMLLFRPQENFKRLNESNKRLAIPPIDEELALEALKQLLRIEREWLPTDDGTSLYIRPFIIATTPFVGVKPADNYKFIIILSPVGAYYASGLEPVEIYVESEYVRTVKGGTGTAKTGGNYAASLLAQNNAHEKGFAQVLWLDGIHRKYIEEVGSMNMFFIIGDKLVTPSLTGSVLAGITRKSCLELAHDLGLTAEQREISIDEIMEAHNSGQLREAFGTGTAAVVSPVSALSYNGVKIGIGDGKIGAVTQKFYDILTGIQWGDIEDTRGWSVEV